MRTGNATFMPATLSDIRAPWLPGTGAFALAHPVTHSPLRMEKRETLSVLAIATLQPRYFASVENDTPNAIWRLPVVR